MPSTVQTDTNPAAAPQSCPSWCVTNHFRFDDRLGEVDQCHSSAWAAFGDGTARFRVDLGSNPEAGSPCLVFVGDEMKHPRDATVIISELAVEEVGPLVDALQWARRTARMDHQEGSLRDAAESVAESLGAIVEVTLTSRRLTDEQRRDILYSTRTHLCAAIDAVVEPS